MQHSINWPQGYLPGFSDNFCSNEVIIANAKVAQVWQFLNDTQYWQQYYDNVSDIRFYHDDNRTTLYDKARFFLKTFGFPVEAEVVEYVPPKDDQPARLAWHGWAGEIGTEDRLDVHHAWLIESLSEGRVRVLTQETQNGIPAKQLAKTHPNPMINGHQDWLDGIVAMVKNK